MAKKSVSWNRSVSAALLAAGLIAGAPGAAKACDPAFCEAWSAVELHTNGAIPADGVIVLRGRYGAPEIPASAVDRVSVTVTGPDQVALAGSLTLVAEPWRAPAMVALVWRPAATLTPGLSYAVAISVDNQPLGAACGGAPATLESAGSVTASDSLAPPAIPPISAAAEFTIEASRSFTDLACCEASGPDVAACSSGESTGCAALRGEGTIQARFTAERAALAAAGDQVGLFGFDLADDSMDMVFRTSDNCAVPKGIVFSTGEILEGAPVCAGEDYVALLGPVELDPNEALASCEGQPVTCAVSESEWDPETCVPWEGWSGGGCGCRSGGGGWDAGGLAATLGIGLMGLRRRRRGRARRAGISEDGC